MSGFETNLKSTRPRPGHYETKTGLETGLETKTGLETFITDIFYTLWKNDSEVAN